MAVVVTTPELMIVGSCFEHRSILSTAELNLATFKIRWCSFSHRYQLTKMGQMRHFSSAMNAHSYGYLMRK